MEEEVTDQPQEDQNEYTGVQVNPQDYFDWESVRDIPQEFLDFLPFGQAYDDVKNENRQLLPLHGPGSLDEIWGDDIGDDAYDDLPYDPNEPNSRPLHEHQYEYLESAIIRNIEFIEFISGGAYGKTYEVTAELLNQNTEQWREVRLACKISLSNISLQDMLILRYLRHENISNLAEIIGIPDRETQYPYAVVCLFFELCDGDFYHLRLQYPTDPLRGKAYPEILSRHWFAQIARALEYIHRNGVVHGDISTQNIFYRFRPNERPNAGDPYAVRFLWAVFKLGDYGQSKYNLPEEEYMRGCLHDISILLLILLSSGTQVSPNLYVKFCQKCRSGQWTGNDPKEWNDVSPSLKDLIGQMEDRNHIMTAAEILQHQWLQENEEDRTERFIVREPEANLKQVYDYWEDL